MARQAGLFTSAGLVDLNESGTRQAGVASVTDVNETVTIWRGVDLDLPRFPQPSLVVGLAFATLVVLPTATAAPTPANAFVQPPEIFAKPFPAASQQQFSSFQPAGFIKTTFPDGWRGYATEVFAKPTPAALQQFSAFQPLGTITSQLSFGWSTGASVVFSRTIIQLGGAADLGEFPQPLPRGWNNGAQFDYRFAQPFPAALQQFHYDPRFKVPASPSNTPAGSGSYLPLVPEVFAKTFPAALQQFIALGLTPIVVPVTTNLPGHGDWPRHLKKPVRPIWDRRPDPYPTPAADEPEASEVAGADPVPATEVARGPADLSNLQRLFNPPLPKLDAPAKKNRKARRAAARAAVEPVIPAALVNADLLEDIDTGSAQTSIVTQAAALGIETDSGHAIGTIDIEATALLLDTDRSAGTVSIAIVAHGAATEDSDQLTATACWNDDDIALQFLLGDQ